MRVPSPASICAVFLLVRGFFCQGQDTKSTNPCCHFPCQNWGVCVRFGIDRYECDCTRTGYYGENCTIPEFWSRVQQLLKPSPDVLHYILTHFKWLWDMINQTFLRNMLIRLVLQVRSSLIPSPPTYNSKYDYLNWESYSNATYYTRILPPVPEDCPTPMGVKGKAALPDPEVLVEKFLLRKKFRPDPQGTNLMFAFFAQHFTHQFFKTHNRVGLGFTKALGHGVDAGHIYGDNLARQLRLRLHKDGKLKYQMIHGEMYLPTVAQAPAKMSYPENVPAKQRLAIGQEVFGLLPGLTMYATLWLREHNRICDILKAEHPTWGDEQLFQTARLIIIGETIKIVIEEYVQHLSGYLLKLKFDPTLIFGTPFQYGNRVSIEFSQLYHWHPLMPDSFHINGDEIPYQQFLFNTSIITYYGLEKLVEAFSKQRAGQIGGGHNIHQVTAKVAVSTIKESRHLRFQSFNQYRKRFKLKPYTSFEEFTGEKIMSRELEELYGDIDALEFYPALLLEKTRPGTIFGQSMVEMGSPFSLKGLLGNPICSPEYWKPSTFGGQTGFDIVKSASLEKLVCLNTKKCPYVAFHVPSANDDQQQNEPKQQTEWVTMTTLDDKLLGEKLQYYYSSSEDEDSDKEDEAAEDKNIRNPEVLEAEYTQDGSAINTGPKGVINDWRKYKQLETEQRQEQKKEMELLIQKLSMTCRSHLDDEREKEKQRELQEKINGKMTLQEYSQLREDVDDEDFLAQYRKQRMDEMRRQLCSGKRFGRVTELSCGEEFLDAVDKEGKATPVMIHIYEADVPGCEAMDGSMLCLAQEYPLVKFCRTRSSVVGASALFTGNALPALLVYRGGELIGNFVRITDQLGDDFFAVDVEALLQEYGLLPDKAAMTPTAIRDAAVAQHSQSDEDDSDLDID
ncbi:prostaglandin G/H synthase 1-like [Brienomyrus brachyistius]|uniref:prostaglandin G/H synthase 1-like n=1 Tax=Brienomyrus brachyistius TaxID=42636 RepID=UPI0020B3B1EC|nr:prostaglandin G/H synthase 1-like [Brienomyrus brachyistius]